MEGIGLQWLVDTFGVVHVFVSILIFILGVIGIVGGAYGNKKIVITSVSILGVILLVMGLVFVGVKQEGKENKERLKEIEDKIKIAESVENHTYSDEKNVEGEEGNTKGIISGEGITISEHSIGVPYEDMIKGIEETKESLGLSIELVEDTKSELNEYDVYYTKVDGSLVGITTTVTKELQEVARVMFELEDGYTGEDEKRLREVVELYVKTLDEDTLDSGAGYFLGSLLSVHEGESMTFDRNGKEYASANSKDGLMFFIDRGEVIY